jgi:uncharacterized protein (TIGR02145 family)
MKKSNQIIVIIGILVFAINCKENSNKNLNKSQEGEKSIETKILNSQVQIGTQIWMTANLNVDRFQNGDSIQEARNREEWNSLLNANQPAWSYYEYKLSNGNMYGKIYNLAAVNDPRGLAPRGWHIPSDSEWIVLKDFVQNSSTKLKSKSGWIENNVYGNGTNETGFNALPAGYRGSEGIDDYLGKYTQWWSSESVPRIFFRSHSVRINNSSDDIITDDDAGQGYYIRCIKN